MSIESGWCGLLCLAAAAAPAKYFGPTRPADSRSRPDQQPTRHQSAVALRPVTDAGERRAAPACAGDSERETSADICLTKVMLNSRELE